MDADQALNIWIKMGLIGQENAETALNAIHNVTKSTNQYSVEIEQAGKKAEEANSHHEISRQIFKELDLLLPGVGSLLADAFDGPIGVAIALTQVVTVLLDKLDAYNKQLDEINDEEIKAHQKTVERLKDSWNDAKTQLAEYHAKLATAGKDEDPEGTDIAKSKELNLAQIDGAKKTAEALNEVYIAQLRNKGATEEQIESAKIQFQLQTASLDDQRNKAAGSEALQAEFDRRKKDKSNLDENADKSVSAYETAKSQAGANHDELDKVQNDLQKMTQTKDVAQTALDKAQSEPNMVQIPGEAAMVPNYQRNIDIKTAQDQVDAAKKQEENLRKREKQLDTKQGKLDEQAEQAQIESENAKKASIFNQARIEQLPGLIKQAKDVENIQRQSAKASPSAQMAKQEVSIGEALTRKYMAGNATQDDVNEIQNIAAGIAGHSVNLNNAITMFENGASNMNYFMGQVSRLTAVLSKFDPNYLANVEKNLQALESRINQPTGQ